MYLKSYLNKNGFQKQLLAGFPHFLEPGRQECWLHALRAQWASPLLVGAVLGSWECSLWEGEHPGCCASSCVDSFPPWTRVSCIRSACWLPVCWALVLPAVTDHCGEGQGVVGRPLAPCMVAETGTCLGAALCCLSAFEELSCVCSLTPGFPALLHVLQESTGFTSRHLLS